MQIGIEAVSLYHCRMVKEAWVPTLGTFPLIRLCHFSLDIAAQILNGVWIS